MALNFSLINSFRKNALIENYMDEKWKSFAVMFLLE